MELLLCSTAPGYRCLAPPPLCTQERRWGHSFRGFFNIAPSRKCSKHDLFSRSRGYAQSSDWLNGARSLTMARAAASWGGELFLGSRCAAPHPASFYHAASITLGSLNVYVLLMASCKGCHFVFKILILRLFSRIYYALHRIKLKCILSVVKYV